MRGRVTAAAAAAAVWGVVVLFQLRDGKQGGDGLRISEKMQWY